MPDVATVLGPLPVSGLGATLPHEHLFCDLTCWWRPASRPEDAALADAPVSAETAPALRNDPLLSRDNLRLDEVDVVIEEVARFVSAGGATIIDVTPVELGRDPTRMAEISRRARVNVVAGCGHYVHAVQDPKVEAESAEEIAERLVGELTEGIGGTGIRAGIIGEIGTSDPLHPQEAKVLRAAARAHAATGAPITLHLHPAGRNGREILTLLHDEGADLAYVVAGHLDASIDEDVGYHRSLLATGCFVEYDSCGTQWSYGSLGYGFPPDIDRAAAVRTLFAQGHGDRLLVSHDIGKKTMLSRWGGPGYAHVLTCFSRVLRDAGLGDDEIQQLTVRNPQALFSR